MVGGLSNMPPSTILSASITATMLTATMLASYTFWEVFSSHKRCVRLRRKLPNALAAWRNPGNSEKEEKMWINLENVFRSAGISYWTATYSCTLVTPNGSYPSASGFGYVAGHRTDSSGRGTGDNLRVFQYMNASSRAARTRDGHDVIIRVVAIHNEGHGRLKILRKVATGVNSLFSNSHALPMLSEFQFEDIIFGIFPKVSSDLQDLYGYWARNSAGDIVEVIMQMLEALAFLHNLNIAHRDAFKDNYLIQWNPESLKTMTLSPSRPRVYLIDFEVAIEFSLDCPVEERVVTGFPVGGSIPPDNYARPHAPEFASGKPYCPFKLDIWQTASSLLGFRSTVAGIDEVLVDMGNSDPDQRPYAQEALDRIRLVVNSMPPESLLISPWMDNDTMVEMDAESQLQKSSMEQVDKT